MPTTSQFTNLALTGSIATGKSTLAVLWRQRGAVVIEADELAHRALLPGTESYSAIVKTFGAGILTPDTTINRRALAEIIFADDQKRAALNAIIHPVVGRLRSEALSELTRTGFTGTVVNAIPLLFETGIEQGFDCIVTIACSAATQQSRLLAKGFTPAQITDRVRAQLPQQTKMDRADFVIWNDSSLRTLAEQADIIWNIIQETRHASP
jgi:dephospho-CoA kinase